jgi:hypothetical protein
MRSRPLTCDVPGFGALWIMRSRSVPGLWIMRSRFVDHAFPGSDLRRSRFS